jgi:hypothetical protein
MGPRILSTNEENRDDVKIIRRTLLDEILGQVKQELVITKDKVVHRTWFARHYNETALKRIKAKDGRDAVDVVWGHEGEGRSDFSWCIIVPPDPQQIDQLFSAVKDHETYGKIMRLLHDQCLAKNVNKRVECDLSFLFRPE